MIVVERQLDPQLILGIIFFLSLSLFHTYTIFILTPFNQNNHKTNDSASRVLKQKLFLNKRSTTVYRKDFFLCYREGRRASDGLVAQGIINSQSENSNATVAFNSQRLHEACKAKGVLELHLLQKEAAQLNSQFQANITPDEMTVRQIQHSQFHVSPKAQNKHKVDANAKNYENYFNKAGDLAIYASKIDAIKDINKMNNDQQQQSSPLQKPPLQQQLMQHRLLQQKRQILQKQVAMENGLSRRQMLRQQSYKIAQQQQVLPPLPLCEIGSDDLIAFQPLIESPTQSTILSPKSSCLSLSISNGSPKMIKTSHIQQQQTPTTQKTLHSPFNSPDCWNLVSASTSTCQINENSLLSDEDWSQQQTLYQV